MPVAKVIGPIPLSEATVAVAGRLHPLATMTAARAAVMASLDQAVLIRPPLANTLDT